MKPSQVIFTLRRIATAIENSRKPDKNLVARDLKKIIAGLYGIDSMNYLGEELHDGITWMVFTVKGKFWGKPYEYKFMFDKYGDSVDAEYISGHKINDNNIGSVLDMWGRYYEEIGPSSNSTDSIDSISFIEDDSDEDGRSWRSFLVKGKKSGAPYEYKLLWDIEYDERRAEYVKGHEFNDMELNNMVDAWVEYINSNQIE